MTENTPTQSSLSKFVYTLIYPAILGSILYSLLPIKPDINYKIGVGIFLFYLVDYVHLYFIMEKKFTQTQKNKLTYILFDLIVSILLFVTFQYKSINPALGVFLMSFIPLCFLFYSIPLKYNIAFYGLFSLLTLAYSVLFTIDYNSSAGFVGIDSSIALQIMVWGMLFIYAIYVIKQISFSKK